MKKMMMTALLMTIAIAASAMNYTEARREALFLSDKMAYELDLTAPQSEAVYEINLDYMLNLGRHTDLYGSAWSRRNADLRYVLTALQWNRLTALDYFYRPVGWNAARAAWTFGVYHRYPRHTVMFRSAPVVYGSYRGGYARNYGRSWHNGVRIGHVAAPNAHRPAVHGHNAYNAHRNYQHHNQPPRVSERHHGGRR